MTTGAEFSEFSDAGDARREADQAFARWLVDATQPDTPADPLVEALTAKYAPTDGKS